MIFSDRRLITLAGRSFDSNSMSTTLRETRIDNRVERRNSTNSGKYRKIPTQHQDSLDDVPDLSNNNQDVSPFIPESSIILSRCKILVYCGAFARTTFRYERLKITKI